MAAKYWVGGTGNLDGSDTTHISDTSGGAGGAVYPVAGDSLTFDGSSGGGTVTFTAALTITNLTTGAHTGTIDTNGQTVVVSATWDGNGTATRTLNLGSSSVTVATWFFVTPTNLTFNCGTSTITVSSTFGTFYPGGLTYATVVFSGSSRTISGSMTCATFTRTGTAAKTNTMTFGGDITVTGTLTINGNSDVNRMLILSGVKGTQRTITAAVVSVTNIDLQDIIGAGAGDWDLSAITGLSGDCGGNSGITFTPPATNYWIGGTGNWDAVAEWASTSGGSASSGRVPLPQDAAVFDANSFSAGSQTVTQNMPRIGSMDWSAATNAPFFTMSTITSFFGSITMLSTMTFNAASQTYTYEGRGASTLISDGKTWIKSISIDCASGSLTLGDALTLSVSTLTLTSGTLDSGGFNVSFHNFVSTGTQTRALIMGGSTWTSTGNINGWTAASTGFTLTPSTSTIRLTGAYTGARIFAGGGLTYHNLENATTGAFALQFTGSNTFNNIHVDASAAARTILFTAGTTTTVGSFTRDGGTNVITIGSITAASHTLTKTGGGTIGLQYLAISYSTATPGSTWYAGSTSTDNGNNSGWSFTDIAVDVSSAAIASFTLSLGNTTTGSGAAESAAIGSISVLFGSIPVSTGGASSDAIPSLCLGHGSFGSGSGGATSALIQALSECLTVNAPTSGGATVGSDIAMAYTLGRASTSYGDASPIVTQAISSYVYGANSASGTASAVATAAIAYLIGRADTATGGATLEAIEAIIVELGGRGSGSGDAFASAIAGLQISYSELAYILREISLLRATSLLLSADFSVSSAAVTQDLTIAADPTVAPAP